MTPERLAARLRSGEQALLEEFGLFVLDEAHLIDDETRGWTFETTISRLHALTKTTDHRIFLICSHPHPALLAPHSGQNGLQRDH